MFVKFISPSTGSYTHVQFLTSWSSAAKYKGSIGAAIYSNKAPTANGTGTPNTILGQGNVTYSTETNMHTKIVTISFDSGITLDANEQYWIAQAWDGETNNLRFAFHEDYNTSLGTVKISRLQKYSTIGGFSWSDGDTLDNSLWAIWFRLYLSLIHI